MTNGRLYIKMPYNKTQYMSFVRNPYFGYRPEMRSVLEKGREDTEKSQFNTIEVFRIQPGD